MNIQAINNIDRGWDADNNDEASHPCEAFIFAEGNES